VVNTVYKSKEIQKECFEKLQITRNEATVRAATGLLCMINDKGLKFWANIFPLHHASSLHCVQATTAW